MYKVLVSFLRLNYPNRQLELKKRWKWSVEGNLIYIFIKVNHTLTDVCVLDAAKINPINEIWIQTGISNVTCHSNCQSFH